jgi:serine protease Do
MNALIHAFDDELVALVQRVQRSLVVLHNGQHGIGAGMIWKREGFILTNYHVIAQWPHRHGRSREDPLRVGLDDGRELPAQVVAQQPEIDLALLHIEANDLPVALVADSRNLRVGQLVLAIGHPWEQRGVVTAGIISGLSTVQTRRRRGEGPYSVDIIRSDVHLAPGNSGGPLVNAVGAVVGINTMIVGGDQGIAIPSHLVSAFVEEAVSQPPRAARNRRAPRPWGGFHPEQFM